MNTKKLIGTIIGVTLFAVLVAGATFAWLTFGTTVGDNVYNGTTMNFLVDYAAGSHISEMPMLDSTTATPETAAKLSVTATKRNDSVDGHLSILLTSTTSSDDTSLTADGVIRWAICRANECTTDFSAAVNAGIAKPGSEIVLLNDAALANGKTCADVNTKIKQMGLPSSSKTNKVNATSYSLCPDISLTKTSGSSSTTNIISTSGTTYYVYFWMDGESLENEHIAQKYSGYIHAYATQLET